MRRFQKNERGEMGIGTLIIFIALIVVAAVAATTMMEVTDSMRDQAEDTGESTMDSLSTYFVLNRVVLNTDEGMTQVTSVDIYCRLAAESGAVGMTYLTVMDSNINLSFNTAAHAVAVAGSHYGVDTVSEEWDDDGNAVQGGDLLVFTIDRSDDTLSPGSDMTVKIVPEKGSVLSFTVSVPDDLDMQHMVVM